MSEQTISEDDLTEIEEAADILEAAVTGMSSAHSLAALSSTLCRVAIAAGIDKDLVLVGIGGAYDMVLKRNSN